MAKGNTKKLKEMKFTDGKAAPDAAVNSPIDNFRSIDEILGIKHQSPFKANTLPDFEKQLDEMNLADMQAMAPRAGLTPIHDRTLLRKRLVDEFKKDYRKKHGYNVAEIMASGGEPLSEDASAVARRILKEGV